MQPILKTQHKDLQLQVGLLNTSSLEMPMFSVSRAIGLYHYHSTYHIVLNLWLLFSFTFWRRPNTVHVVECMNEQNNKSILHPSASPGNILVVIAWLRIQGIASLNDSEMHSSLENDITQREKMWLQ